eukprot:CAMPEP_0194199156 /NCGR_PEP_ID=MMETSP0156-20130528/280_1 /TAXON_ID=33649 /ORGANISM="Thalassionema nitzschioides, Strain L26-B" /LENGTH=167 /DNA_ID=CAMNT_0038924011 /DNA_START=30 /DNA_END=533 /DNA_ORIENTATION=+
MNKIVASILAFLSLSTTVTDATGLRRNSGLGCLPLEYVPQRAIDHSTTNCCANEDCGEGELCRSFNYALKCFPADEIPLSYPALCNDEKIEGYCEEEAVDRNRELDCISLADFGSDIDALIDDPRTNCLSNDDCYDDVSKCRLFVNFLVCDQRSNFVGTYRALCDDI